MGVEFTPLSTLAACSPQTQVGGGVTHHEDQVGDEDLSPKGCGFIISWTTAPLAPCGPSTRASPGCSDGTQPGAPTWFTSCHVGRVEADFGLVLAGVSELSRPFLSLEMPSAEPRSSSAGE